MLANHDARTETETARKELRYHSWILQYIILFGYVIVLHQLSVREKNPNKQGSDAQTCIRTFDTKFKVM